MTPEEWYVRNFDTSKMYDYYERKMMAMQDGSLKDLARVSRQTTQAYKDFMKDTSTYTYTWKWEDEDAFFMDEDANTHNSLFNGPEWGELGGQDG